MDVKSTKTLSLVQLGLLIAIEIIFAFTPLGYLRVGVVEITFMTIPVAIGAIIIGPLAGLLLGTVFGLTSFLQCFGISAFGTILFEINPFLTFVMCFVPRALMGLLTGLLCRALLKTRLNEIVTFTLTGLCAALLNTLFFVSCFFLFFRTAQLDFGEFVMDIGTMNILDVFVAIVGVNGLVEAGVCTVISPAIGKALTHFLHRAHMR